jgi:long-chain acyl-CoA synthetase
MANNKNPRLSYPPDLRQEKPLRPTPLHKLLSNAAAKHPGRIALEFMGTNCTYAQLEAHTTRLAAGLQRLGVGPGTRVGLCLPNCPAAVASYHAVIRLGGVVVNLNPLYTVDELTALLKDSGATIVITTNLSVMAPKLLPHVGKQLRNLIVTDFPAHLPWHLGTLFRLFKRADLTPIPYGKAILRYEDLAATQGQPKPVTIKPTQLAVLQYTGGTTGLPKAAMLSHGALAANVEQIRLWLGETPPQGDAHLALLPLFHCFAMTACMNLALANASRILLLPKLDMNLLLKTIRNGKPTLLPGVPTLFAALANNPKVKPEWFASIRYGVSGGAPLPAEVKQRFEKLSGCRLMEGYGLSEASPVLACNPRHGKGRDGSAGLALPGTSIVAHSLEKPHRPLKPGQTGEIWAKGPQLMDGYLNRKKDTAECMVKGWLRTGDVGHVGEDGYLYITDRLKEMIIVHGYKVYPRHVEDAFYKHPAVHAVAVIGLPHPVKGEAPKAYIQLKDGANATGDELMAFAKQHLSPHERPFAVELRSTLPRTQVGKLSKKDLLAEERAKQKQ